MSETIIAQGKTTNEAIENGLKKLNVSKDKVDIKVIEEEKRSFYSILTPRVVKVELTIKSNNESMKHNDKGNDKTVNKPTEKKVNENINEIKKGVISIKNFLDKFLGGEITYKEEIKDFNIFINIEGEKLSYLIGYRGETINALQTILSSIANKESTSKIRVYLDIAGYRERRIKTLEDLAEKIARTVVRTRKEIMLEPMSAYERKVIHTKLQSSDKVKTFSKGEEPYRKVVITLK